MSAHTSGPWTVEEYGDDDVPSLVIHSDGDTRICFMVTPGRFGDNKQIAANAYLIAAAPDLLKACLWLKPYAEIQIRNHPGADDTPRWKMMLAAIVKAEGRS